MQCSPESTVRFDLDGCRFPVCVVPLSRVVDLLQVTHAPERVREYRELMLQGESFPPVSVLPVARRYFVTDGHKRLSAYQGLGHAEIPVEVWTARRWLADQARQLAFSLRRIGRLLRGTSRRSPSAYLAGVARHWKRIAISLASLCFNREGSR